MKAFITGINGFVGKHLSEFLLSKGFEVTGTDLTDGFDGNSNVKYYKLDVLDADKLKQIMNDIKPDVIFHLAAISSVQVCEEKPELARKIVIEGTNNLLSACVKNKINPTIIITSSAHVYGIPEYTPIDELHPLKPVTAYGKSKLEQENTALNFFKRYGLKVIISRSFNHIGPGQATGFVCSDFAKQIAEIEKGLIQPEIHVGDLSSKRDFTDVRDIVDAYVMLAEKGKPGEIYNIGRGKAYSIQEILEKMISKSSIKIRIEKSKLKKSAIPIFVADNRKFKNLTGWKPKIGIDKSLTDIINYWIDLISSL
jgi:GDP-4-dehydro-6-deoxy-D-mannose reductase